MIGVFMELIKSNAALFISVITMGCLIWSNLENRKSRQYQYRPHLVFQKHLEKTYVFDYLKDNVDYTPLFIKHFDGKLEWIKVKVINIGVGFAKDLEIQLDYSEIVNELLNFEKDFKDYYYCKSDSSSFGVNSFLDVDVDVCDYYDYKGRKKTKTHYFNTMTVGQESELYLSIHINLLGFVCMINQYKFKNSFEIPYKIIYKSIDDKTLTQTGRIEVSYSPNYDMGLNHREYNELLNHLVNDGVDIMNEVSVKLINTITFSAK